MLQKHAQRMGKVWILDWPARSPDLSHVLGEYVKNFAVNNKVERALFKILRRDFKNSGNVLQCWNLDCVAVPKYKNEGIPGSYVVPANMFSEHYHVLLCMIHSSYINAGSQVYLSKSSLIWLLMPLAHQACFFLNHFSTWENLYFMQNTFLDWKAIFKFSDLMFYALLFFFHSL